MERIEEELRAGLARAAGQPPVLPALGEQVVRKGRRVRRRRLAAAGAAVAVVLVATGALLLPTRHPVADPATREPAPVGAPVVTMAYQDTDGYEVVWAGAQRHVTNLGNATALATVPEGLLLVNGRDLQVLPENGVRRTLITGLNGETAAVSADGRFATVVTRTAGRLRLTEIDIKAGQVRRWVPITAPLLTTDEPVNPVFYSGDAVMVNIGASKAARWEPGPDQVVGTLDGPTQVLGGGPGGALALTEKNCTQVGFVKTAFQPWKLCGQDFVGISPDGARVLSLGLDHSAVTVQDTADGRGGRSWHLTDPARSIGWETGDSFLYTTARGADPSVIVVRCVVSTGACRTATVAGDTLPTPLPAYGG